MARTRVGYTGGSTANPTYRRIGNHTETVQVDFDPEVVSYEELLELFWRSHNASRRAWSRQYMSAVFYHDADQEQLARSIKENLEKHDERTLRTEILPASRFYMAEDYHQKYILQGDALLNHEFRRIYPDFSEFVDSAAAAKVDGYLYGCGTMEELRQMLGGLGLSPRAGEHLLDRVRKFRG